MKKMISIVCLFFFMSLSSQADNGFGDLASQLNAVTKTAFSETSKQMAVKINLAGKQRMLTQKMSKESLLISLKIAPEQNKKSIKATAKLFEQTLIGLQAGNQSLGLTRVLIPSNALSILLI